MSATGEKEKPAENSKSTKLEIDEPSEENNKKLEVSCKDDTSVSTINYCINVLTLERIILLSLLLYTYINHIASVYSCK